MAFLPKRRPDRLRKGGTDGCGSVRIGPRPARPLPVAIRARRPRVWPEPESSVMPVQPAVPTPTTPAPTAASTSAPVAAPQGGAGASAADMLRAARSYRRELDNQRDQVQSLRSRLAEELAEDPSDGTPAPAAEARAGLVERIAAQDARLADLDRQIAEADQRVANAAALPGATVQPPRSDFSEEVIIVPVVMVTVFVLFPITLAYARRLWRRGGAPVVAAVPADVQDRLQQLSDAVETIGVEVERIGEGQRFLTRLLSEGPMRVPLVAAQGTAAPSEVPATLPQGTPPAAEPPAGDAPGGATPRG